MVTTKKHCLYCHRAFFCRRNPNQSYCAAPACQNSRKRDWRKQKLAKDPDYRQNQRRANEGWRRRHADYWRRYRETHTEYTDKNRLRQRARDQKRAKATVEINASHLAKSDASPVTQTAQLAVKSGFYQLVPLTRPDLAKCDALTVQLAVITGVSPELSPRAEWRAERDVPLYPDLRKQTFASSLKPKVLLSLSSGMRKCELRRMRRNRHIDFERQGPFLTPDITKAKKSRYIPLDAKTWKVLTDWLEQTKDQYALDSLVFPGADGDTEFNNMTKSWERLLKIAKIENFTWHDMRHDYASQLVMSGVDLNTVRELLGHADIKMTLRYAHLAPAHKKLAVQSLQDRREKMLASV